MVKNIDTGKLVDDAIARVGRLFILALLVTGLFRFGVLLMNASNTGGTNFTLCWIAFACFFTSFLLIPLILLQATHCFEFLKKIACDVDVPCYTSAVASWAFLGLAIFFIFLFAVLIMSVVEPPRSFSEVFS